MKKYLFSLTNILMVALASVCFVSCGDDDEGNSGSGNSTSSGVVVNAKYGFYQTYGAKEWELIFSNCNLESTEMLYNTYDIMSITLEAEQESTEIPTGEFTQGFTITIVKGEADAYYESESRKNITGKLTIKKNGGNYTVSYSGVNFYDNDSNTPSVKGASFSYTGSIVKFKGEIKQE